MISDLITDKINQELQPFINSAVKALLLKDDPRLLIYRDLITLADWDEAKKVDVIVSIHLLQLSLDLHRQVLSQTSERKTEIILIGDYLSAQHYDLLASHSEYQLIKTLASVTKTINQLNINVDKISPHNFNQCIKINAQIDTLIINQLLKYFNLAELNLVITEASYYYSLIAFSQSESSVDEVKSMIPFRRSSLNNTERQIHVRYQGLVHMIKKQLKRHFHLAYLA